MPRHIAGFVLQRHDHGYGRIPPGCSATCQTVIRQVAPSGSIFASSRQNATCAIVPPNGSRWGRVLYSHAEGRPSLSDWNPWAGPISERQALGQKPMTERRAPVVGTVPVVRVVPDLKMPAAQLAVAPALAQPCWQLLLR